MGRGMIGNSEQASGARKPERAPPAWLGATLPVWIKVLARYRFPVSRRGFWRFLLPTLTSPWSSLFAALETARYGRGIGAVKIEPPPIFIVGFLRTGSTLLHELLAADARHTAPTMYQCTGPRHFLTTRPLVGPIFESRVPRRRPMDNMVQGIYRPFEDEFALCFNGHDSIYMFLFFPRNAGRAAAALDLRENPRWQADFERFLKAVLLNRRGQRLVLKSPPHTLRVRMLSEMFPGARFIHLVRDPLSVIPSALHTVRMLIETYGLQTASDADIEDWVFGNFDAMHRSIAESRPLLAPGRFCEVRYEALAANPLAELEQIYAQLDLGDFAPARPAFEAYLSGIKDYRKNRFDVDIGLRRKILDRCGWVMERYGYGRA